VFRAPTTTGIEVGDDSTNSRQALGRRATFVAGGGVDHLPPRGQIMATTEHGTQQDVVSFLKDQHEEIKRLLNDVEIGVGQQRAESFLELRRLLAVHETVEEEFVHPRARKTISGGHAVVSARLHEENEAKKMLADLEKIGVDHLDFTIQFAEFRGAVLAHAEREESEEFPALQAESDPEQLQRMARVVRAAQSMAPTRPHAGVESATANMIAGPFAAMLDRARDTFKKV
jgi:hemerythrin superfamily protein